MALGSSPRERGARLRGPAHAGHSGLIPAGAGSTTRRSVQESTARAHPRGSGEHERRIRIGVLVVGSSPRERGALRRRHGRGSLEGLIPAGAGSTSRGRRTGRRWRAHPRGSGEHKRAKHSAKPGSGSSPRERGAPLPRTEGDLRGGLIPAGAGSTETRPARCGANRAHPRGSGEHPPVIGERGAVLGSSPRERGARPATPDVACACGLIPAGAGSTASGSGGARGRRAHPRGSGEHAGAPMAAAGGLGSSPRERGALAERPVHIARDGLIPAGAGSTTHHSRASSSVWAHPRGSGEHTDSGVSINPLDGSSPRERGARGMITLPSGAVGLIPAGAGSTRLTQACGGTAGAHPRGSGEHEPLTAPNVVSLGSSPRERGARPSGSLLPARPGLIPAGAGSTVGTLTSFRDREAHPRGSGEHVHRPRAVHPRSGSSPRERGAHP